MEKHREPNVTDSMLNTVDTDGQSGRWSLKCRLAIGITVVAVLFAVLVVLVLKVKVAHTSHTEKTEALYACNQNTSREDNTIVVNNTPAQLFTCVYNTPNEYLGKLRTDPFGDNCRHNSEHDFCSCNKDGYSCNKCGHSGPKLPNFCFCDAISQCGNSFDAIGKTKCESCREYFATSPYKERGNCSCSQTQTINNITCSCHEGFTNLMCSSIEKRICKYSFVNKKIFDTFGSCNKSNDDTCVLEGCDGAAFICELFNEGNKDLRKNADTCKINVNSKQCIFTEKITTQQEDATLRNNPSTCEKIFANVHLLCFMLTLIFVLNLSFLLF